MSTRMHAAESARFELDDDSVVVVVGSGAGGGTLAHELWKRGCTVVLLEAGPYLRNEDYVNNEWEAFNQMAWLDPRTTSGSWRIARDFPNLPAWIVKAVGGTTTHWSGATPRFKEHEFKTRTIYGRIDGATLLDWPLTLADLEPYYDRAELKMGVTHRHGRPPLPANNNYKVFANGAEKVGYRHYATGPYATNAEPYDGRPASIQDGFNFQGDKNRRQVVHPGLGDPQGAARPGCWTCARTARRSRSPTRPPARWTGCSTSTRTGKLHRQKARVVAWPATRSRPRGCCCSPPPRCSRTGWPTPPAKVGRNYMRHTTGSVYAQFDQPVRMYRGETMAGLDRGRVPARPRPRLRRAATTWRPSPWGRPSWPASWTRAPGGRASPPSWTATQHTAGMWIVGEDMPQEGNRVTLNTTVTDPHGLPVPNVHFDDHPNDVAMREHGYQPGRGAVLRRSARCRRSGPRRIPPRTTSAPRG